MKLIAALVLLVVAVSALPQFDTKSHPIAEHVINRITEFSESIRERGLDPVHIKKESGSFSLPSERVFSAVGLAEDVILEGLSNIIINSVVFDPVSSIVTFDLWVPRIYGSVGLASGAVVVFDRLVEGDGSGSLAISDIRARGFVFITLGVQGVVATGANVEASIGNIQSDISLKFSTPNREIDASESLNNFLNVTVSNKLKEFNRQVNELIAHYLLNFLNRP